MRLPFVSRKEHDRVVSSLCRSHNKQVNIIKSAHEDSAYNIRTGLRRVLAKFAKVSLSCFHNDTTTWRLVFDLDPRPIIFALEKGNDHFMIEQIAEELKIKVIKELRSMNIQHPDDLGLER